MVRFRFIAAPAILVALSIKNGRDFTKMANWGGSVPGHIADTYLWMLKPALVPLGIVFLVLLVLRRPEAGAGRGKAAMPAHELAALLGFALVPFVAVSLSTLSDHYWMRYSLNSVVGLAGILVLILSAIGGTNRLAGVSVLIIFGVFFAVGRFLPENRPAEHGVPLVNTSEELQPFLEHMPPDVPIVVGYVNAFVELEHYSSPQLARRLYYLTEPADSAAVDGMAGIESELPRFARLVHFRAHIEDYRRFIESGRRFYVVLPIGYIARQAVAGRLVLQTRGTDEFRYFEGNAEASR